MKLWPLRIAAATWIAVLVLLLGTVLNAHRAIETGGEAARSTYLAAFWLFVAAMGAGVLAIHCLARHLAPPPPAKRE